MSDWHRIHSLWTSFIKLWAGKDYLDSYPITLLLIIPATVPLTQNIGIEIQKAKNMHQFRSWVYILIALANLIISIPLIDRFGGVGGALGTAISLLIGNGVVMNWYYHYRVDSIWLFLEGSLKVWTSVCFSGDSWATT